MSQVTKAYKSLKEYAGTAANAGIIIVTGGVEQITTVVIYRCPCVEPKMLGPGCNETQTSLSCSQALNFGYGFSFIFAPAFALFIFSVAASPKLWKIVTGCTKKVEKHKEDAQTISWTLSSIIFGAFISPVTWVCIALVDGQYLACSITPLPYRLGANNFETCEDVSALIFFDSNAI